MAADRRTDKIVWLGAFKPRGKYNNEITYCAVSPLGVSPCLTAAMGMGGGYVPKIMICNREYSPRSALPKAENSADKE